MLKLILIAAVVLIGGLLILASTRPDSFRVQRSTRIAAGPDVVFALVNDLHQFNRWNPWERKDPATKGEYSGASSGVGATYAWESDKTGVGSMTIAEASAPSQVAMTLDFLKPFRATNRAEFTMTPVEGGTEVIWAMSGASPFITKLIGLVFNMDRMIGKDFEAGLANLKTLAEQSGPASVISSAARRTASHQEQQS